jgi:hypothetical protein
MKTPLRTLTAEERDYLKRCQKTTMEQRFQWLINAQEFAKEAKKNWRKEK